MMSKKISDRFSTVFSRDKPKEENRHEKSYFNESYFTCKLAYNPSKLSLMKVEAVIDVGPDAGSPMMVNCKWMVKKDNRLTEIQGLKSSCYQPCIQDVGCSIIVMIEPLIEGKIYSGATITKETNQLELGSALQTELTDLKKKLYHYAEPVAFEAIAQSVSGEEIEKAYSNMELPFDCSLVLSKQGASDFDIMVKSAGNPVQFWIAKEFPTVQYIRKSCNTVQIHFSHSHSIRFAFKKSTDREMIGLLLRTLTANSTIDWPMKTGRLISDGETQQELPAEVLEEIQKSLSKDGLADEKQEPKTQETMPQQKNVITAQGEEKKKEEQRNQSRVNSSQSNAESQSNIILKNQYRELLKNYHCEKLANNKLQAELASKTQQLAEKNTLKADNEALTSKLEKASEDCRFFKNQLTLLKRSYKEKQEELMKVRQDKEILEKRLQEGQQHLKNRKSDSLSSGSAMERKISEVTSLNQQLSESNQQLKLEVEKLQNELQKSRKKIESLCQEKILTSPIKSEPQISVESRQDRKLISNLQFKLANLEMLLKHRSGEKGSESMGLHKIINSLTETITEKEQQIVQLRAINKQLLSKINTQ